MTKKIIFGKNAVLKVKKGEIQFIRMNKIITTKLKTINKRIYSKNIVLIFRH